MAAIVVAECETAEDVMRLARESAARRKAWNAKPIPASPPAPVLPIKYDASDEAIALGEEFEGRFERRQRIRIPEIIEAVASFYRLTPYDICSARRTKEVVLPRHVAMWIARNYTLKSLPEIGRLMGGRDHTTVLSGERRISALLVSDTNTELKADITKILAKVGLKREWQ